VVKVVEVVRGNDGTSLLGMVIGQFYGLFQGLF